METMFRCANLNLELPTATGLNRILEDISLSVESGEFVSIIGASGTGKTSLLRVLGGLVGPTAGSELYFEGAALRGPSRDVGFVFQDYAASLLPWRTVSQNVRLGLEDLKISSAERARRVSEALDMVGLEKWGNDYPWRLSGGMQQRVQIARALVMRPAAILMDEPFGALDAMTKGQLQDELQRIHQLTKMTTVFVTHDTDEAVYLSDRIIVLTGTPGSIGEVIDIDLPRPRTQLTTRESPRFLELRRRTLQAIGHLVEDDATAAG